MKLSLSVLSAAALTSTSVVGVHAEAADSKPESSTPYKVNANGYLQPRLPYPEFLDRFLHFVLVDLDNGWSSGNTYRDEYGKTLPAYLNYAVADGKGSLGLSNDANNAGAVYPAFHHALYIRAFLAYWRHTGNPECLARARQLADWNLARRTPAHWLYGSMFYSTIYKGKAGGAVDGDALMPDKAAIMASALIELSDATKDPEYRAAAEAVATTLAKTQRPEGSWPFRVNPQTGEVREDYTSSIIYEVRLFDELDSDGDQRWREPQAKALKWLLKGPVQTMNWNGFFEDIGENGSNRTNFDCIDTARWLVAHRKENPSYLPTALKLNDWITQEFADRRNEWAPAEGLREQKACFYTMGVHTVHWAALLADLHEATGDASFKRQALNACALSTYWIRDDGSIPVGPDWVRDETWFSCCFGTALFLNDALSRYPELMDPAK